MVRKRVVSITSGKIPAFFWPSFGLYFIPHFTSLRSVPFGIKYRPHYSQKKPGILPSENRNHSLLTKIVRKIQLFIYRLQPLAIVQVMLGSKNCRRNAMTCKRSWTVPPLLGQLATLASHLAVPERKL